MMETGNGGLLFLRTIVAAKAKDDADLVPVVEVMNTLRLTSVGNNIVLDGEVSYANLEKLLKLAQQFKGGF